MSHYSHFVVRLTEDSGRNPVEEIESLVARSMEDAKSHALLGTSRPGQGFRADPCARHVVVFYSTPTGEIEGCVGEIVARWSKQKPPARIPALYQPSREQVQGWWTLKGIKRITPGKKLGDIPGRSATGHPAVSTFRNPKSQMTFAGWTFERDPATSLCEEVAP